ncbi:MAG: hypothetical protein ACOCRK_01715 [bacterium]
MKRLIRKSEFFDAFLGKNNYDYCEIFINPTSNEIKSIKNNDYTDGSIRGIIDNSGDIYIWPGEVLHYQINDLNNESLGAQGHINVETGIHFALDAEGNWVFDGNGQFDNNFYKFANELQKYRNIFSKFGDINADVYLYINGPDGDSLPFSVKFDTIIKDMNQYFTENGMLRFIRNDYTDIVANKLNL